MKKSATENNEAVESLLVMVHLEASWTLLQVIVVLDKVTLQEAMIIWRKHTQKVNWRRMTMEIFL